VTVGKIYTRKIPSLAVRYFLYGLSAVNLPTKLAALRYENRTRGMAC
jgi:hypothetical protein